MTHSSPISKPTMDALSQLSEELNQAREDILEHLVHLMTEELAASRERRPSTVDYPYNTLVRELTDLDSFVFNLDTTTGRHPHAADLASETLPHRISELLHYETAFPMLQGCVPIKQVLGSGSVRDELTALTGDVLYEKSHVFKLNDKKKKAGGWLRGLCRKNEE
jgi:hypothetical protein